MALDKSNYQIPGTPTSGDLCSYIIDSPCVGDPVVQEILLEGNGVLGLMAYELEELWWIAPEHMPWHKKREAIGDSEPCTGEELVISRCAFSLSLAIHQSSIFQWESLMYGNHDAEEGFLFTEITHERGNGETRDQKTDCCCARDDLQYPVPGNEFHKLIFGMASSSDCVRTGSLHRMSYNMAKCA